MTPKRKFSRAGVQHIFQISVSRGVLFCTSADCLFLFTLICVKARQYNVRITQLVIMINHFHIQGIFNSLEDMENFMQSIDWTFAIIYNRHYGLKGKVFHKPFGSSPKVKPIKVSDNSIYIANNPVVKHAVTSSRDYKFNFLRYAPVYNVTTGRYEKNAHPFSEEYHEDEASDELKKLIKIVKHCCKRGEYLSYRFFDSERYNALPENERLQLIDIIINTYNVIDYSIIIDKWGTMDNFFNVLDQVSGSEYDVDDDREDEDYRHYYKMFRIAAEEGYDIRKMRFSSRKGYSKLIRRFRSEAGASEIELSKFFNEA